MRLPNVGVRSGRAFLTRGFGVVNARNVLNTGSVFDDPTNRKLSTDSAVELDLYAMSMGRLQRTAYPLTVVILLISAGSWFLRQESSQQVRKLGDLSHDVQSLRVGTSTYQQAKGIADKYGTVKYDDHLGTRDCADGYFERCAYQIPIKSPVMSKLGHHFPVTFGFRPWSGYAHIFIDEGKVAEYSFSVIFESTDGQWRGVGAEEYNSLPERAVAASVSNSYLVSRNDIMMMDERNGLGFSLDSALTPQSSRQERRRAWSLEFQCLESKGCDEICDVMPEGWEDFYTLRGKMDVQKYGEKYLFCRHESTNP
jgi:hypothetical protein